MKALAEKLIALLVPSWAVDSVLGDLDEEFRRVAARKGRSAASRWYVRASVAVALRYAAQRLRHPSGAPPRPSGPSERAFFGSLLMDSGTDIRLALRQMARRPGFSAAAVLTLALGIAVNAAVLSLVNAVLFKPLAPFEPERVVRISGRTSTGGSTSTFSYAEFAALREDPPAALTDIAAVHNATIVLRAPGLQDQLLGEIASAAYFRIRAPRALHGRTLVEADDARGAAPVVMLSERYWRRAFGGDPAVVGRAVALNGRPFTIAGIAREEFTGSFIAAPIDLWLTLEPSIDFLGAGAAVGSAVRPLFLLARLHPGVAASQAERELTGFARTVGLMRREASDVRIEVGPGTLLHGRRRAMATLLLSIVGALTATVLLIAVSNVANLLLAQAIGRRRDVAVRLSLGAGRGRLVRQLAAETLVLAACAGAVGLLVASWMASAFDTVAVLPGLDLRLNLSPDWRVAAATASVAMLAGLIAAIAPAVAATRADVTSYLKEGGGTVGSRRAARLRGSLVVAQVAIAVLVAVAGGLLAKSARAAAATDLGFRTAQAFATDIDLNVRGYTEERARVFHRSLLEKISGLPAVQTAALATRAPLDASTPGLRVLSEGDRPEPEPGRPHGLEASYYVVSPGYFETVGVPLVAGRRFDHRDTAAIANVAVINEVLAERVWPSQRPGQVIGRRFRVARASATTLRLDGDVEVVGVARNAKYRTVGEDPQPHVYLPLEQHPVTDMALLVRSASAVMPIRETHAVIASLDPEVQGFFTRTLEEHTRVSLLPARFAAAASAATAALAALLGAIGLFGLSACVVSERRRELAVRLALGATPSMIRRDVLRQGLALAGLGCVVGLAGALSASRLLASVLYDVSPTDPTVYAGVAAGVLVIAAAACWIPARRASLVEPLAALRD